MDRKRIIDVAAGREKADVVIKNTTVVDVLGGSLIKGDVAVCGDKFAGVGSYSGVTEIDGTGRYVMPSFYDAHLHFESVMVRPSEYLKISVPKGVTAYNADPHEIANVCGEKGIRFMLDDVRGIPADIRFGLGEMMNFPGVVGCDHDVLAKLDVRPVIDGHAPGVSGNPLNAYIAAGVSTDHECESVEEALEKVSKGMYVLIREGSQTRNLRTLIKAVNKTNLRRFLFCTDDRNIEDLVGLGTIGNAVRLSVECGMDPIDAITIASLNANEAYGIKNTGAVAPGWTADFLVCADITAQRVEKVFYHGALVAENGRPLFSVSPADVSGVTGTVHIKPVTAKDMAFPFDPARPVMRVFPGTVVTEAVKADGPEGLNLMCCIERHDASGDIGHCYVDGFRLRGGAVAQTVGHD